MTAPSPVTTNGPLFHALRLRALDVFDGLTDGLDFFRGVVGNIDVELFLDLHNQLDGIERVGAARSFTNEVSVVILSLSTPNCSATISITRSLTTPRCWSSEFQYLAQGTARAISRGTKHPHSKSSRLQISHHPNVLRGTPWRLLLDAAPTEQSTRGGNPKIYRVSHKTGRDITQFPRPVYM